jgi:hypothetical protein
MDEYRFLVKFPPHIKVEGKVLVKATYFYLKNDEGMASLRVWNGETYWTTEGVLGPDKRCSSKMV